MRRHPAVAFSRLLWYANVRNDVYKENATWMDADRSQCIPSFFLRATLARGLLRTGTVSIRVGSPPPLIDVVPVCSEACSRGAGGGPQYATTFLT